MPKKGVINNPAGSKPTWASPKALLADFECFLADSKPHPVTESVNVEHGSTWQIEEVTQLSKQRPITIRQFAVWKGIHRTTITTGYSQGVFKDAYLTILGTCESYAERRLYEAKCPVANIIFVLKNCYGWSDRRKAELGDTDSRPLTPEARAYLDKAMATA
jgi:hypothetical protein